MMEIGLGTVCADLNGKKTKTKMTGKLKSKWAQKLTRNGDSMDDDIDNVG